MQALTLRYYCMNIDCEIIYLKIYSYGFYSMGKKKRKNKKNKILESSKISTADRQTFLEAMESLIDVQDDLTGKKFDLIEDKSFKVRKKKSSFRESGEQIKATLDLYGFCLHSGYDYMELKIAINTIWLRYRL